MWFPAPVFLTSHDRNPKWPLIVFGAAWTENIWRAFRVNWKRRFQIPPGKSNLVPRVAHLTARFFGNQRGKEYFQSSLILPPKSDMPDRLSQTSSSETLININSATRKKLWLVFMCDFLKTFCGISFAYSEITTTVNRESSFTTA